MSISWLVWYVSEVHSNLSLSILRYLWQNLHFEYHFGVKRCRYRVEHRPPAFCWWQEWVNVKKNKMKGLKNWHLPPQDCDKSLCTLPPNSSTSPLLNSEQSFTIGCSCLTPEHSSSFYFIPLTGAFSRIPGIQSHICNCVGISWCLATYGDVRKAYIYPFQEKCLKCCRKLTISLKWSILIL